MSALVSPNPLSGSKITSIKDALKLPAFNAMYQGSSTDSSGLKAKDPVLGTAFIKAVVHDFIKAGGKNVDINFFMSLFGSQTISVDTKTIYNRYVTDIDHNIYIEADVTASGANAAFTAQVLRANHAAGGKYSYPLKGYTLVDKENNIFYSIEDVDTSVDYAHVLTLKPWDQTITGSLKKNKKYLVMPARMVGGNSGPQPTSAAQTIGYAQMVSPFRLRRDWKVEIDLMRGYRDKLRFSLMFDNEGNKIDSWDTYEAQVARENLQLALNILAFLGTPISNPDLIAGTGAMVVDQDHTGFYGYLPTVKYGGGKIIDIDPAVGLDLDADLEPFMLAQDQLKQTTRFLIRHGKAFKAGLNRRGNKMVKYEGLGLDQFAAFNRTGEKLVKQEISSYEYLGFVWDFMEWGSLNDTRLLGSNYFDNMGIGVPLDGIVDGNTNAPISPIEFYQYGDKETGDYFETQNDLRNITFNEEIQGYCAQSVMMATHCPGQHLLFNPTNGQ